MTFAFYLSFLKVKSLAILHLLVKIGIGQELFLAMLYYLQQSPHLYEVFQGDPLTQQMRAGISCGTTTSASKPFSCAGIMFC